MNAVIEIVETGVVYRNPKPHLRAVHAMHPSLSVLDGKQLVATAWVYDTRTGQTLPSVYAISEDGGRTFTNPKPTGFLAQTCKLAVLQDGRLLAVYRRHDRPGLWANLVALRKDDWKNLGEVPLWRGAASGMAGEHNQSDELSKLKFGYPSLKQLPDGDALLVFWCEEDAVCNIRWIRLSVGG